MKSPLVRPRKLAISLFGYLAMGTALGAFSTLASPNQTAAHGDALPAGALLRLGTAPLSTGLTSGNVLFSRDGRQLYSWGDDGIVHVWDPATGRQVRTFSTGGGGSKGQYSIALSADERMLAAGKMDGTAHVFDFRTGKHLGSIATQRRDRVSMMSLALSADGRLLASGSEDLRIHIWDTATRKDLISLDVMRDPTFRMEFGERASVLVSGANTGMPGGDCVLVWDVATGKELRRWSVSGMSGARWALTGDNRTIAVPEGGELALYDLATVKLVRRLPKRPVAGALAFNEPGIFLASAHEDGIRVWEVANGRERSCLGLRGGVTRSEEPPVVSLALSPNGNRLAATVWCSPLVRVFDVTTGRELFQQTAHRNRIYGLSFSPDGRTLATGEAYSRDSLVCLWDLTKPKRPRVCGGHQRGMCGVCFTPDGRAVVSGGWDNAVRVWDAMTGQELRRFEIGSAAMKDFRAADSLAVSPDGKTVTLFTVAKLPDGRRLDKSLLQRWELATGNKVLERAGPDPYDSGTLSPDGRWLAPDGKRFSLLEVLSGSLIAQGSEDLNHLSALTVAPDSGTVAGINTFGGDKPDSVILWEAWTGNVVKRFQSEGSVSALAFSPDGRILAAAGAATSAIQLWDVATGKSLQRLEGQVADVTRMEFSPNGATLATGLGDSTTLVWDVTSGRKHTVPGHARLSAVDLRRLWADLASADAGCGQEAAWTLSAAPADALPFLKGHLRAVPPPNSDRLAHLVMDLDSPRFSVREAATRELATLGRKATRALEASQGKLSAEGRGRAAGLLAAPALIRSAEIVRTLRAIQALSRMRCAEARAVLGELAKGATGARETEEAQAALARWCMWR